MQVLREQSLNFKRRKVENLDQMLN